MTIFANSRRNHTIAAFMLLAWLLALFVGIANGCVLSEVTREPAPDHAATSAQRHNDHDHPGQEHEKDACKAFCDAQASTQTKQKSSDASHIDHIDGLVIHTAAYFLPLLPPRAATAGMAVLFDQAPSLRLTRLTL